MGVRMFCDEWHHHQPAAFAYQSRKKKFGLKYIWNCENEYWEDITSPPPGLSSPTHLPLFNFSYLCTAAMPAGSGELQTKRGDNF